MPAVDLFHVDCAVTLKRIYVFFVLEVGSRYVHILGAPAIRLERGHGTSPAGSGHRVASAGGGDLPVGSATPQPGRCCLTLVNAGRIIALADGREAAAVRLLGAAAAFRKRVGPRFC
jgi:hypothetical protein